MVISDCRAALWNSSSGGSARGGILQGKIADYETLRSQSEHLVKIWIGPDGKAEV